MKYRSLKIDAIFIKKVDKRFRVSKKVTPVKMYIFQFLTAFLEGIFTGDLGDRRPRLRFLSGWNRNQAGLFDALRGAI